MGCSIFSSSTRKKKLLKAYSTEKDLKIKRFSIPSPKLISLYNNYASLKCLGSGSFAEVMLCMHRPSKEHRALKIIKKPFPSASFLSEGNPGSEFKIMQVLDHPNIVKFYEIFEDLDYTYLSLEYCKGGTLHTKVKDSLQVTEQNLADIMFQVFSAISYIHSKGIVHRDLKTKNLLLVNFEDLMVKIADFGSACFLDSSKKAKGYCGTKLFIAPEVNGESYNEKVDVWSCGMIMYSLVNKEVELCDTSNEEGVRVFIEKAIKTSEILSKNEGVAELFSKLLRWNPEERISANDALEDKWIKKSSKLWSSTTMSSTLT